MLVSKGSPQHTIEYYSLSVSAYTAALTSRIDSSILWCNLWSFWNKNFTRSDTVLMPRRKIHRRLSFPNFLLNMALSLPSDVPPAICFLRILAPSASSVPSLLLLLLPSLSLAIFLSFLSHLFEHQSVIGFLIKSGFKQFLAVSG